MIDKDICDSYQYSIDNPKKMRTKQFELRIFQPYFSSLIMGTTLNFVLSQQKINSQSLITSTTRSLADKVIQFYTKNYDEYVMSLNRESPHHL